MTVFLVLFLSISAWAQQFQYRFDGTFQTEATPNQDVPTIVNYSLHWNETSSEIQGIYQDNYFSDNQPRMVTGSVSGEGRVFNIILPAPIAGVRQLTFTSSQTGASSGTISIKATTKSNIGSVIDDFSGFAIMSLTPGTGSGPDNEEESCSIGFGALTDLCGLYNGLLNELNDPQNRCDIAGRNPRLEFSPDTSFRLILDYIPGIQNLPMHLIGTFLPSPTTNTITVSRRVCNLLPGTTFAPNNCKTMILSGTFSPLGNNVQFSGIYSINDDTSGESCSYSMNLNRESEY